MKRKLLLLFALLTILLNLNIVKGQVNNFLLRTVYMPFIRMKNLIVLLQKTEQVCSELSKENQILRESLKEQDLSDLKLKSLSTNVTVGEILSYSPLGIPEDVLVKVDENLSQSPESYSVTDLRGNLIGKATQYYKGVVVVMTLYNTKFRAGVETKNPYYTGLLVGGRNPTVIYVPFDAPAEIGDTIYTSSLSSVLRSDIPVGTVYKVVKDTSNPIFVKLYLTPFFKPFTSKLVLLYGI